MQQQLGAKKKESNTTAFTESAIAGLAAKEDFSSVKLKRSDSSNNSHMGEYPPFKERMLIQVKGIGNIDKNSLKKVKRVNRLVL